MVERILVAGDTGDGKTYVGLQLAKWLLPTGAQVYAMDTDESYDRSFEEFPGVSAEEGGNVHVIGALDWAECLEFKALILVEQAYTETGDRPARGDSRPSRGSRRGQNRGDREDRDEDGSSRENGRVASSGLLVPGRDWLYLDRADTAWRWCSDYFTEYVYGLGMAQRLLDARKKSANKRAMQIQANDKADWQVIRTNFTAWLNPLVYRTRCNVLLTAGVQAPRSDDDDDVRRVYGPIGRKPSGHTSLREVVHSVLILEQDRDRWMITTAKDRARDYFWRETLVNFPVQYGVAKAGWSREATAQASGR